MYVLSGREIPRFPFLLPVFLSSIFIGGTTRDWKEERRSIPFVSTEVKTRRL